MDTEWCLYCEKSTNGSPFCSELCRSQAHSPADTLPSTVASSSCSASSTSGSSDEPVIVHQVIDSSSWAGVAEWAANVPSGVSAGAPSRSDYVAAARVSHPPPILLRPKPPTLAMSIPPQAPFFRSQPITTPSSSPETSSSTLASPVTESIIGTPPARHSVFGALRSWVPSPKAQAQAAVDSSEPTFTILCRSPHSKAMRIVPCKVPPRAPSWSSPASSDRDDDDDVWYEQPANFHPYRARQTQHAY